MVEGASREFCSDTARREKKLKFNRGARLATPWDVGGKDKIRPLWRHYFQNTQALILVIDANDRDRVDQARDEIHRMLTEDELRDVPTSRTCRTR